MPDVLPCDPFPAAPGVLLFEQFEMINIAQIENLRRDVGFAWRQILRLALLGVAAGVALALTISLRVS